MQRTQPQAPAETGRPPRALILLKSASVRCEAVICPVAGERLDPSSSTLLLMCLSSSTLDLWEWSLVTELLLCCDPTTGTQLCTKVAGLAWQGSFCFCSALGSGLALARGPSWEASDFLFLARWGAETESLKVLTTVLPSQSVSTASWLLAKNVTLPSRQAACLVAFQAPCSSCTTSSGICDCPAANLARAGHPLQNFQLAGQPAWDDQWSCVYGTGPTAGESTNPNKRMRILRFWTTIQFPTAALRQPYGNQNTKV